MDDLDKETEGWANWKKKDRIEVFEMIAKNIKTKKLKASPKIVWVCSHFHTNVDKQDYKYVSRRHKKSFKNNIIVSSSTGTAMWWMNANKDGHLSPDDARKVAEK